MTTSIPSAETLFSFEQEINAIRDDALSKVGQADADYIRRVIRWQRALDLLSRLVIVLGFIHPLFWVAGVLMLALAKILDNMEIGHNVMHGQYDWMNDPHINSRNFEWDIAADGESWKRYHNHEHHTYTNIIGKDRDYGYGLLRLSDDIPWRKKNLWQIITYLNLSLLFQWGVAYHELAAERIFFGKRRKDSHLPISREELKAAFFSKIGKQVFKDYVFWPLLCFPVFWSVLLGNVCANLIRNLWTSTIIFCGHFTEEAHTFSEEECQNETRGQWYYRQILGSSNLEGARWFHILTGHLSCQIEHHLFPDIPARHYPGMAKQVEQVCKAHGIPYNSGSFGHQYLTVVKRVLRYSLPDKSGRGTLATH
ncbi:MAG: acyl-CoA desaturase [Thalassobium sp.]|jgi:fatty acid desaturase|uniref:Acyl-CoA desaturase n=1 Tax=Thalassolituus pacificus TaxID=2975440 RepID=A0A9X3AR47_9GAMM|nr:acyl-CoA desaturase [Thalassolituus pacificus]MCT7358354.1 acyl-CoA desaturase [Thalassolituus pacificus]PHS64573.1 MAG: acyl-CoA desaturase [Thalassobium sp.]